MSMLRRAANIGALRRPRRPLSTVSSTDRSSHQRYLALLRGMVNSNDGMRLVNEIESNFYSAIGAPVAKKDNNTKSVLNKFLITSKNVTGYDKNLKKMVNLQRLIALVSLSKYANDIELAFDMVECISVNRNSTGFMVVGIMEIIDHCVATAQLGNAMVAYNRLRNMGHGMDALGFQGLLRALIHDCRLSDAKFLMDGQAEVSSAGLAAVAEPLVLSGDSVHFHSLLLRYLGSYRAGIKGALPGLFSVARSLSLARARRFMSPADLNDDERAAIAQSWASLDGFLEARRDELCSPSSAGALTYSLLLRLVAVERDLLARLPDRGVSEEEEEEDFSWSDATLDDDLADGLSIFPFLAEHSRAPINAELSGSFAINDLSTELHHFRPPRKGVAKAAESSGPLLFSSKLFPGAYKKELRMLRRGHAQPHDDSLLSHDLQGALHNLFVAIARRETEGEEGAQGGAEEEDEEGEEGDVDEEYDDDDDDEDYDDDAASTATNVSSSAVPAAGNALLDSRRFDEKMFSLGVGPAPAAEDAFSAGLAFADQFFAPNPNPEAAAAPARDYRDYNGIFFGQTRADGHEGDPPLR